MILAKVLASRLKRFIGKIISAHQSVLVSGRSIFDGVLEIYDILDFSIRAK